MKQQKGNSITGKGKKCTNLVIESSVNTAKKQFYYEKREKVHKSRNRMRDVAVNWGILLREKVENAQIS